MWNYFFYYITANLRSHCADFNKSYTNRFLETGGVLSFLFHPQSWLLQNGSQMNLVFTHGNEIICFYVYYGVAVGHKNKIKRKKLINFVLII